MKFDSSQRSQVKNDNTVDDDDDDTRNGKDKK